MLSFIITDLCKTMLREGKGTAFALSPASGVLEPFCDQVVEVTAFSDMWGEYNDNVICKVSVYLQRQRHLQGDQVFISFVMLW